jgi:hypothetical protein
MNLIVVMIPLLLGIGIYCLVGQTALGWFCLVWAILIMINSFDDNRRK